MTKNLPMTIDLFEKIPSPQLFRVKNHRSRKESFEVADIFQEGG